MKTPGTCELSPLKPFEPAWWARGRHTQTILGGMGLSSLFDRNAMVVVPLEDGDRLVACEDRPKAEVELRGAVVLLHGLGSEADSSDMRRISRHFVARDYLVWRLNHRGVGAGAGLARRRLYNGAVSSDFASVLEALSHRYPGLPVFAAGLSMSGNVLLYYLGERGTHAHEALRGAVAVCPAVDLAATVRSIEQPDNQFYHDRFGLLLPEFALHNEKRGGRPAAESLRGVRTLRGFDAQITCPDWGYFDPDDYYHRGSALPKVSNIAVPTVVFADEEDPVVPYESVCRAGFSAAVQVVSTRGGGHLGFLSDNVTPLGDRRWMDYAIVAAVEGFARAP